VGSNGRFSDGFLLGALIGGAAVFLAGTQRGNKVLKILMEEGKVGFNELMEEIDELKTEAREMQEEAEEEVDEDIDEVVEEVVKTNGASHNPAPKPESTKRFFKKSK